jgi:hypothetical protein
VEVVIAIVSYIIALSNGVIAISRVSLRGKGSIGISLSDEIAAHASRARNDTET